MTMKTYQATQWNIKLYKPHRQENPDIPVDYHEVVDHHQPSY